MMVLSAAVALFSYRYLDVPHLPHLRFVPPNIAANRFFLPWIVVHAGGGATALLLGPLQFQSRLRQRRPGLHRWIGRGYVAGCIAGGASSLWLAAEGVAGIIAQAGFSIGGRLWLWTSARGWLAIRERHVQEHRRWMVRSFALTFGALTLRIYLPIALALGVSFTNADRAIAWLSWVPNAVIAELFVRNRIKLTPATGLVARNRLSLVLLGVFIACSAAAQTPSATSSEVVEPATLTVAVSGLRNDKGQVLTWLWNGPAGFPLDGSTSYRLTVIDSKAAVNGVVTVDFRVPPAMYAVSVLHDENRDGKMDTNFLGMPTKGYGASNNAESMHAPSFDRAKFTVPRSGASISIKTKYFPLFW
jgi:uncharacterized protein (DUF2141 family)/uncharacterized membrane protein